MCDWICKLSKLNLELEFLQPCLMLCICIVVLHFSNLELEFVIEAPVANLGHLEVILTFAPFLHVGTFSQSVAVELLNCHLLAGSLARGCLATCDSGCTLAMVGLSFEQSNIVASRLDNHQPGGCVHLGWL